MNFPAPGLVFLLLVAAYVLGRLHQARRTIEREMRLEARHSEQCAKLNCFALPIATITMADFVGYGVLLLLLLLCGLAQVTRQR